MDFKRIDSDFAGKWTVFFANRGESGGKMQVFWGFFEAGVGVIRWPFGACMCWFFSAIGGGWRIKMLDEQFSRVIESPSELIF